MKLKRFLTGVLSAVMALSVCALPAAAAGDDASVKDPTDPKLTASTIDKTQVGSITIHKYGQVTAPSADEQENGTGEADATVGSNKNNQPLEGVEFTLYRVKTTDDLLKYYDALEGASVEEFTAGDCFTDKNNSSTWAESTLNNAYKDKTSNGTDTNATVGKVKTAKTNAKGAAQFNGLPVGMYLVIETNKVQSVTKTVTPFLVSIPMTRIGDKGDTNKNNNLKQWLYDVVVYPKNSTAQGSVTLVKQGKHGDATPENLGGVMFKLFQYQGADGSGQYVDITDKLTNKTPVGTESYVVTGSGNDLGKITFENLPMGKYYVQEYGYTGKGSDKGYIINTNGKYGFKIDDQGQVAVQTETGETDWVTAGDGFSAGNGVITITNYKPEFEKTVEPRTGTGTTSTDKHQADYGIGDKVPYTLTIKVPENVAKLHTFKVVDTTLKDQLEHIEEGFTLTATDKDDRPQTLTEKAAYTKKITEDTDTNTSILTVDFTTTALTNVAGGTITIKYYATLGAGAVVAEKGNLNTAKLLYSRKTDTDGSSETDKKPYEITDEGVVYTFMTSIVKKGKGGLYNDKPMQGVTFALYRKVEDTEWNKDDKVTIAGQEYTKNGAVTGATAVKLGLAANESETWVQIYYDAKGRKLEAETDDKGIVEYKGLPSGTYKFIETKTLDKYNLLTSPVDAKLSLSYTTKWKDTSTYDENGNLTNHKSDTVEYKNGDPKAVIQVVNRSGFTLPVTGGFGTLLFSGIGVLLVLAGVAVLFSMKKKNDRA